jgi:hypothetical protein
MTTRKKIASVAFTGAAATMAVGLGTLPAMAATTWHVKNGGTTYTGKTVKGKNTTGVTSLKSSYDGTVLTCPKSDATISGSIKSTASGTGVKLGTLSKATFKSCTAPGGIKFTAALSTGDTPSLKVSTYAAGVTKGTLAGVKAKITGSSLNSCTGKVSGNLPGSFINSKHELVADTAGAYDLTIKSAADCGGLTANKKAYFKATYTITTPTELTISS